MIKRFWFSFSEQPLPIGVQHGCGLSAYSYQDALDLLKGRVFEGMELPTIDKVVEDIDISTLDSGHVLPNMGDISSRGIWFPIGVEV